MRIHTGFHRFTEIIKLSKLTSGKWCGKMFFFYNFRELNAPSMNQKPGKENSTKIPGVACPGAPIADLLPRSLIQEIVQYQEPNSIYPRCAPAYL